MSSLLYVERDEFGKDQTRGILTLRDHPDRRYQTVEDERRKDGVIVRKETCIPAGTYPLALRVAPDQSPAFAHHYYVHRDAPDGVLLSKARYVTLPAAAQKLYRPHDVIWVQNVPRFQYILLHWGNTDDDTAGCLIVGRLRGIVHGQPGVLQSRFAYEELYPLVAGAIRKGGQTITYRDLR